MPELPEVEVVRLGLEPALVGSTIQSVSVFEPRSLKRHDARRGDFVAMLEGRTVLSAERRGKFLWFPLDSAGSAGSAGSALGQHSGDALVAHLGMSGQVLLRAPDAAPDRHLRIQYQVKHPVLGELAINFVDQRIFGSMAVDELVTQGIGIGNVQVLVPSQAAHIALDPVDPTFDDDAFIARLRTKSTGIKRALLDQTLLSGIGNIYADEALWAARLHFDRASDTLSVKQARTLLAEVRQVLMKALAEGGTSFDAQYVNVNGESGYFSHSLNAYGQQGKPCPRCGTEMRRVSFMNRGSHFCTRCQKP
ncbi:bifunctional DNA-formamidopyrimidine glycosylase/DNA-(apurinic or apyrimidinic site) lyase [Alpinimonas psychrophila]|uniref:Formamidopyrimidine-DNA glycosylase n=1 Tax=Alpinimonas psychrophila TaxID=748908 RepID=A0A7W3PP07_9MICO|nr:bifunctional DNA-formamidopyrimidine glycosylase/DNA-(apurinic or apyrimidinic site) lyase [Alpinimonas psychrophila]MBA8828977.1 formamidopyrimidine-DNA glycosylase [Alpinimonas psychrophila]